MTSLKGFLGIGDLTLIGWLTVILYFWAAISCWITARKLRLAAKDIDDAKELRGWRLMTVAFLALGVNKQLDLQTTVTETGRLIAKFQGWYDQRGPAQLVFIAVVALACVIASVMLVKWAHKAPAATGLALATSTMLIGYVAIRAVSFHYFDRLIYGNFLGFRLNSLVEIGGIGVVLATSYWRRSRIRKSKPGSLQRS